MSNLIKEATYLQVHNAAMQWVGEKERETFQGDVDYFKNNWQSSLGMNAYVARHIEKEQTNGC